jgi:SAM-dependent methyltransferase
MPVDFSVISGCRVCRGDNLQPILHLGTQPLANSLRTRSDLIRNDFPQAPLSLAFCEDCSLVQIMETVDPVVLFRDYHYFSSVSPAFVEHARQLAKETITRFQLTSGSLVMEAASNDGYLLRHYKDAGVTVLGIDPAENIARQARNSGIPTMGLFFNSESAKDLAKRGYVADVFHANNVLAHVVDQNDFVQGVKSVLKPDGVAIFEFPYAGDMFANTEFDTIYHEHLCYFSLGAVSELMLRNGLAVFDVERIPVHGGSLRIHVGHREIYGKLMPSDSVQLLQAEEIMRGMHQLPFYLDFAARVNMLGMQLWKAIYKVKTTGARIAAYGASAKGSTLLNYFGIGADVLEFIADRSPYKQGYYSPAFNLPILDPRELLKRQIPYALLLTWNFYEEITAQNKEWLDKGGMWIVPLPRVIIGATPTLTP